MERRDIAGSRGAGDRFSRLFEDLEAQESGRAQHERFGEFSDLVAGEAADHSLTDRLAGAEGSRVGVTVAGAHFSGRLQRAAPAWISVSTEGGGDALISVAHVEELSVGTRAHAAPTETLSFASPLRAWREEGVPCAFAVVGVGGTRMIVGSLALVASDYIEVVEESRRQVAGRGGGAARGGLLVPLSRVAYVRPRGRVL